MGATFCRVTSSIPVAHLNPTSTEGTQKCPIGAAPNLINNPAIITNTANFGLSEIFKPKAISKAHNLPPKRKIDPKL